MERFEIAPLEATVGAIVTGVDLAAIDEVSWRKIEAAFLEFGVLIFPDQNLSDEAQIAFGSRFGNIEELLPGVKLVPLSNRREDGGLAGDDEHLAQILRGVEVWHTDSSYMPLASKAAALSADVVPPVGGGTEWADMRAAYDALDESMKARIADLSAYHSYFYSQSQIGHDVEVGSGYGFGGETSPLRPLVKVHPDTGRPSLFIGRHAHGIPGMEPEASKQLLDDLLSFACQPPRTYEHQWQPGDLAVWDNRCLLHRARPYDHHAEVRIMRHTRVAGDPASEMAG
ncbi:MAG: TauD/TfdA family dioxygenase [Deltaproteobacteria bacterium]|nr:TauD/TfdA family dioxygenase [Deltaproteobacteria bacterium]